VKGKGKAERVSESERQRTYKSVRKEHVKVKEKGIRIERRKRKERTRGKGNKKGKEWKKGNGKEEIIKN
jgi:hypothetical protein